MLISKIYNSTSEEVKKDLVGGLAVGLVWGLAWGLVGGLVWVLVWGLAVILINYKEALPFLYGFYPIILLILGIVIIFEIMFWLMPKEKLKKDTNLFWHTCKRKLENIFEILMVLSGIAQVYILIRELNKYLDYKLYQEILKWIGYIGAGILIIVTVCLIFYIWLKLNELKYKGGNHGKSD